MPMFVQSSTTLLVQLHTKMYILLQLYTILYKICFYFYNNMQEEAERCKGMAPDPCQLIQRQDLGLKCSAWEVLDINRYLVKIKVQPSLKNRVKCGVWFGEVRWGGSLHEP